MCYTGTCKNENSFTGLCSSSPGRVPRDCPMKMADEMSMDWLITDKCGKPLEEEENEDAY